MQSSVRTSSLLALLALFLLVPASAAAQELSIRKVVPSQPTPRSKGAAEPAPPVKPGASTVTATVLVVFALQ
jgi:hypothetical protein